MTPFIISGIASIILGMSKSGLKGMGIVIVTLMALTHGAKASTGILLPLLIFADILAVSYYNRHTQWKYLLRFLPWMMGGVIIGVLIGKDLPEDIFKKGIAIIILISVAIMFISERYDQKKVSNKIWFAGSVGFLAGFTTMIGNLAGAFTNIFFLAMRIPKNEFIGTAAWLFLIINVFKLPFHFFSWKTITEHSLITDLYMITFVIVGFIVGLKIVKRFKDHQYRKFILIMTAIGGIIILFK